VSGGGGEPFPPEELERLGLYDPKAADGAERLELIRYVLALGATIEEVAATSNLGELALDLDLRPRGPLTVGQVIEGLDIEWPTATRLLTALGMATDPDEAVTAEEAETIWLFVTSTGLLGEDAAVQLARVTGAAMAKVAETLVGNFRIQVEVPRRDAGVRYVDLVKEYSDIATSLLPAFVRSLDALLRQQILAVAKRMWSTDEEHSTVTLWRTVGFVDLVGYTEVAGSLSARDLATVLVDFDERTARAVRQGNGQVVKMIGDEAMFVTEEPGDACRIALNLVAAFAENQTPPVRVGLATGEMVSVFGDLYGLDVNLAARLVAVAEPDTVVVSQRTRDGAPDFGFEALPARPLKGFPDPITSYKLVSSHGARETLRLPSPGTAER
jgi:adenylate cyclase